MDLSERLDEIRERRYQAGSWVPACGGAEVPFVRNGKRYLYCWHTLTGQHAYLDLDADIVLTDEEAFRLFST